jgi:hypothetical protein
MPTEKRMKYLARLEAKQASQYTQAERQAEFDKFMGEFARLGISEESFEEVKDFATKARDWVTTGTPYSGSIPLVGLDRNLVYTLTSSKRNPCGVMLQNTKQPPTEAQQEQQQQSSQANTNKEHKPKQNKIISGPRNARAAQRPRPTGGSV